MGGGDLNSKKSCHPSTIKNQELVWKAEQAAVAENKKMFELEKERKMERNKEELNKLIHENKSVDGVDSLNWMYDKPNKKADQEEYLLGRSIGKNYEDPENSNKDYIPSVARRVAGASMIAEASDAQVDVDRKLREDPLILIKERERAARAAILNNPIQRKKIAELLRKEQESRKNKKEKKKKKKKDSDLDMKLASKLSALGTNKDIDLAALLACDSSSSDDVKNKKSEKHKKVKKVKKKKSDKAKKIDSSHGQSSNDKTDKCSSKSSCFNISKYSSDEKRLPHIENSPNSRKRRNDSDKFSTGTDKTDQEKSRDVKYANKHKKYSTDTSYRRQVDSNKGSTTPQEKSEPSSGSRTKSVESDKRRQDNRHPTSQEHRKHDSKISDEEKKARLAAMLAAGSEREASRSQRVAAHRAAEAAAERAPRLPPAAPRALPDSLEARIHSNRHYIQRDHAHMDRNFAKR